MKHALAAHGVEPLSPPQRITQPGAWHGARIVYVRDPDGHAIELVQHADTSTVTP